MSTSADLGGRAGSDGLGLGLRGTPAGPPNETARTVVACNTRFWAMADRPRAPYHEDMRQRAADGSSLANLLAMAGAPGVDESDLDPEDAGSAEEAPLLAAARGFIEDLRDDDQLALTDDAAVRRLADRMVAWLEKLDAANVARATGEWLLEQDEVDELFADDATLEVILRRHFARR